MFTPPFSEPEIEERVEGTVRKISGYKDDYCRKAEGFYSSEDFSADGGFVYFAEEFFDNRSCKKSTRNEHKSIALEIIKGFGSGNGNIEETEHSADVLRCSGDIHGVEKDEADGGEEKNVDVADDRRRFVEVFFEPHFFDNEQGSVEKTPGDELPVRTVPETGEEPYNED